MSLMNQMIEKEKEKKKDHKASTSAYKTPRYVEKNYSTDQIIGDKKKGIITRSKVAQEQILLCLLS